MGMTRRARARITFRGRDISDDVSNFAYTDNNDETDDISVALSDREERWLNELSPVAGDTMEAAIEVFDWNGPGDTRFINLSEFELDQFTYSDTARLNAVAVPITSSARSEKKNRSWKKIALSGIAADIAGNAGLALVYETDIDPFYDVADQNDKSDLEFLEELCKSDGLSMKITKRQLIIFEESKYEALPAVATIRKGSRNIIGFPRFERNSKDVFKACEISYFDPKTDETYTGYFEAPDAPDVGHTLKLRESYNSEVDDMHLDRKSMARLRERNKNEWKCNITLVGDIRFFSGINVELVGWGMFDGKYHITTARHTIGSGGYTVALNTRRCLRGY